MHVAIIMDGNGRWAERRGLARSAGHRAGARAVRTIVEGGRDVSKSPAHAVRVLRRQLDTSRQEVASLMRLLKRYLVSETARCLDERRAA